MRFSHTLVAKLAFRQINGRFPTRQNIPGSLFRVFPGRLAFCLRNVVPNPSVLASHVFLGFSKCGNFIISYTQTTDFDVVSGGCMKIKYRLHWWLFLRNRQLRPVDDVALFDDCCIEHRLFIAVCFWPGDVNRILVYGRGEYEGDFPHTVRCYLTVTTVPSLQRCEGCVRTLDTISDYDADGAGECAMRCLYHSLTVHTSLELVQPHPAFMPQLCLKHRDRVLVNTGNFLHVLSLGCESQWSPPALGASSDQHQSGWRSAAGGADDCDSDCVSHTLSCLELETGDADVASPLSQAAGERCGRPWRFDMRAPLPPPVRCRARRLGTSGGGSDAYEFLDEDQEARPEKLSSFRKRRLADKKYEFSDENSENVPQFRLAAAAAAAGGSGGAAGGGDRAAEMPTGSLLNVAGGIYSKRRRVPSTTSTAGSDDDLSLCSGSTGVLRVIDRNTEPDLWCGEPASPRPLLLSLDSDVDSVASGGVRTAARSCCVQVSRVFVELDDERSSVVTDIEDDDLCRSTGYHHTLPVQVHGTSHSQLQLVSRGKADRLSLARVEVNQLSLDVEQYCHEISQKLCAQSEKKYWFCDDYDVEIVDVCGETGEVVAVAVVLIQAAAGSAVAGTGSAIRRSAPVVGASGALCRRQFCGHFMFGWCVYSGRYRLLATSQLLEVADQRRATATPAHHWNPSKLLGQQLRHPSLAPPVSSYDNVAVMTNSSELIGSSLRSLVNWDSMIALLLHDQPSPPS